MTRSSPDILGARWIRPGNGVRGFERGDDAFGAGEQTRGGDGIVVGDGGIFGAALVGEPGVLGADRGIVEARGNRMRGGDLSVFVLQDVGVRALQNAGARAGETLRGAEARGVFAEFFAAAAGFDADHFYVGVSQERVEEADRVGAAADAGIEMRGQTLFGGENLLARFAADDGLKIADHRRIRMRAENRAEQIVRGANVGDPVAHRFVDGVFERVAAGLDADDLRAEHAHARNVERLARHVFGAHVDDAFEAEMRGDGGAGDAVLAGAGFRDDARLVHFYGEQALADGVVDFVRAGVEQVFALEVDARAAEMFREALGELQRRRAADEIFQEVLELRLECWVGFGELVGALEFEERDHEGFGDVAAAVGAEASGGLGGGGELGGHGEFVEGLLLQFGEKRSTVDS